MLKTPDSSPQESKRLCKTNNDNLIEIPASSFTAFRLLYATPAEISHLATTIFLGKVPHSWIKLSNKRPFFSRDKQSKSSTIKWISTTTSGVKKHLTKYAGRGTLELENVKPAPSDNLGSLHSHDIPYQIWDGTSPERSSSHRAENPEDQDYSDSSDVLSIDSEKFDNILYGKVFETSAINSKDILDKTCTDYVEPENQAHPAFTSFTEQGRTSVPSIKRISKKVFAKFSETNQLSSADDAGGLDPHQSVVSAISIPNKCDEIESRTGNDSDLESGPVITDHSHESQISSCLPPGTVDLPNGPSNASSKEQTSLEEISKMDSTKGERNQLKVQFANPQPKERINNERLEDEYVIAEREHNRTIRKMQSLAHKSKGKARATSSRLKIKFVGNLLHKKKVGEIIRIDKMLVMIKKVYNITSVPSFTERGELDTFIQDHWREYYVISRATGIPSNPLSIQFFDVSKGKSFEGKADYSISLNKHLRAEFFSHVDKTIRIADLVDDGLRIFIMNAKYTTVAYKWLYMIKEVLGENFFSILRVNFAEEIIQMRINVPPGLLRTSAVESNTMKLYEKSKGYDVEKDALITFLTSKVESHLRGCVNTNGKADAWSSHNPNPAFCFKFYDRIEWVPSPGNSLLAQSQLLRDEASLEYRQVTKEELFLQDSEGNKLVRPFPIEGFLSRITNISGKEFSKLRAFYKIQYFVSSENILFFSSFFRGLPPSPQNQLLNEKANRAVLCDSFPEIYQRNPFELDENEHFPWISSSGFEKFDSEAVEEFSRKLQQIVGARAMIDMATIRNVKPIPFHSIQQRHLYFQSYLWYSSPTILDDMSILDSGFEIELFSGSHLRLLAPSRAIRDEWVDRLNNLALYWRLNRAQLTMSETLKKFTNMSTLRSEDYVDSNLYFNPGSLEIKKSIANSEIFTTSALAMSTYILCSGYLYQKQKKHSNFSRFFVVLCPGYLLVFSLSKRSKVSGVWKNTPYFERYMTIPISECYIYSESCTQLDLVGSQKIKSPGQGDLPRLYPDSWKSSEEEFMRCFSIWFGGKRALRHGARYSGLNSVQVAPTPKNPGMVHMTRKSGVTGKILVFLARSRQEREQWVYNLLQEINRFSGK